MDKKEKNLKSIRKEENELDLLRQEVDSLGEIQRIRREYDRMYEAVAKIPPYTHDEIQALINDHRPSQSDLHHQADRYLLVFCMLLLALMASILWHTAPSGITLLNIAVIVLAIATLWIALCATRSLYLQWQMHRLRCQPLRMSHYSDRLSRLSHRRCLWLAFILRDSYGTQSKTSKRCLELRCIRIPSYTIAVCLFCLIALNADKAFAATHEYAKVTTTTEESDEAICDNVTKILEQL